MSRLLKRYKPWRFRRQQLSLARWAEERRKGRRQIVLRQAFTYVVLMIALRDVVDNIFDGGHAFNVGVSYIIQYVVTGICIGYEVWGKQEGKYKKAQLKSSSPCTHLQ